MLFSLSFLGVQFLRLDVRPSKFPGGGFIHKVRPSKDTNDLKIQIIQEDLVNQEIQIENVGTNGCNNY